MGRIPEDELERLKRETDLVELVRRRVQLERRGGDWVGLCPFHEDHEPSLVVTPAKNLFHCLGCGAAGSVVDWVMKTEGVSFRHAVELLREGLPAVAGPARPVRTSTVRRLRPPVALEAGDQELLDQTVAYYHETLLATQAGLEYLERRAIRDDEATERFRLGYSNRTLGLRLPERNRQTGAELRGRLEAVGLIRATGHEHFSGCVTFPVLDAEGHVVEVYGRKLNNNSHHSLPLRCQA